jgi:succinyl-diaminopimelate desuccinylase
MNTFDSQIASNSVDWLEATARLVNIPSVSHEEGPLVDHIEQRLRAVPWLEVHRIGMNVIARTNFGRPQRLILAGHTDTVPVNQNAVARIEPRVDGDVLFGLGSADMKSGLAVFLHLLETIDEPAVDLTGVFYECEEVAAIHNGLPKIFASHPELLRGDAAILGEPTNARIEAGCQGTMRVLLTLGGARAHTARPWMGRNAIHRAAAVIASFETWTAAGGRQPVIDGCEYREAVQVVKIEGGVAGNVVPDRVVLTINHRFAPDRTPDEATAFLRSLIGESVLSDDALLEVVDLSNGTPPSLTHPLLDGLQRRIGLTPVAKLGWTDVAFFTANGIPATNFGPGDPTVAHTRDEFVPRADLDRAAAVLHDLIQTGV